MKTKEQIALQEVESESMKISGAEAVIRCLLAEGVDLIYGYPGGAIMPVYDELYKFQDELNHVLTRHEQGATHAAQGYARTSGKVGVAIATSGPGATNLVTGLPMHKSTLHPWFVLLVKVGSHLLGSDAFQETDIIGISTPVTKWNYQITKASEIPEIFAKAFYIARSGRPGPVLIDITKTHSSILSTLPIKNVKGYEVIKPVSALDTHAVTKAAELINQGQKAFHRLGARRHIRECGGGIKSLCRKVGDSCCLDHTGTFCIAHCPPTQCRYGRNAR
jgi:acetolactate synthase-1/2/3 large subunit